jgi:hypothetical protein
LEFRSKCTRRASQAQAAWTDPQHAVDLSIALLSTEALDTFSARFQHLESQGHGMQHVVRHKGILSAASAELAKRAVCDEECIFSLKLLHFHFLPHPQVAADSVFRTGFARIMDVAAQVIRPLTLGYTSIQVAARVDTSRVCVWKSQHTQFG